MLPPPVRYICAINVVVFHAIFCTLVTLQLNAAAPAFASAHNINILEAVALHGTRWVATKAHQMNGEIGAKRKRAWRG
jgi:hypothetical protein